jgi:4-hydroxythreonine-4-phosphate dehydrogenase
MSGSGRRLTLHNLPTIAITLGDPAGIGPEVVAKTLRDARLPRGFRYEVLGDLRGAKPGKLTRAGSRSALKALADAAHGCRTGKYAAMITGPVHKEALAQIQPDFVGQTEFLARTCGMPDDAAVMCLTDPKLTIALCSNHCSLLDALKRLNPKRIIYVAKITRDFLQRSGRARPGRTLAFAGVNPHLGEGGLFGDEDTRLVAPAVRQLNREGLAIVHAPADTLFHLAVNQRAFDAVLCAYHDQGLIPFKLVAFETGVNVTLGLPIIRTSPDHGTALEIAGKNKADHRSMLAAVRLAARLTKNKQEDIKK